MNQLQLRPYQEEALQAIEFNRLRGKRRQLISLPTGSGKTLIFSRYIQQQGVRSLILGASLELSDQTKQRFMQLDKIAQVGLVDGRHKEFDKQIVIASIQSACVQANLEMLQAQKFQIIVIDEAHHSVAESYRKVLTALGAFSKDGPLLIGFTATPFRSDNKGLKDIFEVVAYEKSIRDLVLAGYLTKPVATKVVTDIYFSAVDTESEATLSKVMNTPAMRKLVVDKYQEIALKKKALAFCVNVEHAHALAVTFNEAGIVAQTIFGEMPKEKREQILQDFKEGAIDVLCNCNLLTEGFDEPSIEVVILARPTKSKGLYQQMVGRGLRLFPNKTSCIVIDFSDKSHSICTAAVLQESATAEHEQIKRKRKTQEQNIPKNLDPILKSALADMDILSEQEFFWGKEGTMHILNGMNSRICVVRVSAGHSAYYYSPYKCIILADNVDFDYAFGAAQDYARIHCKEFVLSDIKASWRNELASQAQLRILRARGFKKDIKKLTKGQADLLIKSNKKKTYKQ